jgi:hypothetical protein
MLFSRSELDDMAVLALFQVSLAQLWRGFSVIVALFWRD